MARAVILRAEEDGRLKPGGTVLGYTAGRNGTSLALVCAARGYRIRIVTSDAFSNEKMDHMAALQVTGRLGPGATVVARIADSGLKYPSTDVYRKTSSGRDDRHGGEQ